MAFLDPELDRKRLDDTYTGMSDGELEKLAQSSDTMTELAREALDAELVRRGASLEGLASSASTDVPEFQSLVTIRKFVNLPDALIAKGCVESAGIECFMADDNYIRMDWFLSNFLGGIKLKVKPEDVADANLILDQPIPESFDVDGVGAVDQPRCPACQSLDVTFQELNQPVSFATAYVGIPIPVHRQAWRCHECKQEWEDAQTEA